VSVLVVAVALVSALGLINLVFVLALSRRLRRFEELFAGLQPAEVGASTKPAGSAVAPFTAVAVDGTAVDERWFTAPTLVTFLAPGCPACAELMPSIVAAAGDGRALAVIEDGGEPAEAYLSALAGTATVLAGDQARSAVVAFGVRGYPAVCLVDAGGIISATGTHLLGAPHPVSA
jgi:thiol-disulfide isomerase/thioredoxin